MARHQAQPDKADPITAPPFAAEARKGPPIAIYAVTANDHDLVQRFAANFAMVDLIVVADRGSSDGTPEALRNLGARVVNAANLSHDAARAAALEAIAPGYVCLALELTDLLQGNWREAVRAGWKATTQNGLHDATWFHGAGSRGWSDLVLGRVHARNARPIADNAIGSAGAETVHLNGVTIEHRPHPRALSAGGLCSASPDLLQQGCALFLKGQLASAVTLLRRHLADVSDPVAQRDTWRMLAAALRVQGDYGGASAALHKAAQDHPNCHAVLVDLTVCHHDAATWEACYDAARAAVAMPQEQSAPSIGLRSSHNTPFDLGAIAAHHTGRFAEALRLGHGAIARMPDNDRMRDNARFYREAAVREGILPGPSCARARLILVSGPWSGGTSAIAGMLARLGARGLGPYQATPDPRTPISYESEAFVRAVRAGIEIQEASVSRADVTQASRLLAELHADMAWGTFTTPQDDNAAPFFAKYPASALLIKEIAEVFELQIIAVRRPIEAIERTRLRRGWPALYGEAGARIIHEALQGPEAKHYLSITLDYGSAIADPSAAAEQLAQLVGNVSQARIAAAADFISNRTPSRDQDSPAAADGTVWPTSR